MISLTVKGAAAQTYAIQQLGLELYTDNPKAFVYIANATPFSWYNATVYVDGEWKWSGTLTTNQDGYSLQFFRIPWWPVDPYYHNVSLQMGNLPTWYTSQPGMAADLNVRYVVVHRLVEPGGTFPTGFSGFSELDLFDPKTADPATGYVYDWQTTPVPDAIVSACPRDVMPAYRLLNVVVNTVPTGCTRIRAGGSSGNRCPEFPTIVNQIVSNDRDAYNALHMVVFNSIEQWDSRKNGWTVLHGNQPFGTTIGVVDNQSQWRTSAVVVHELGHAAGLPHGHSSCTSQAEATRDLMCETGGRRVFRGYCSALYNHRFPQAIF